MLIFFAYVLGVKGETNYYTCAILMLNVYFTTLGINVLNMILFSLIF